MDIDTSKIINFILFFPGFLFSLSLHEAAHGWMADKFGDPTAKQGGRVTLNPFPHMDPIGTVLLPILGYFGGGFLIGWGVPVPVDYRNLKNVKKDGFFIAAAGPFSNLVLALLMAGFFHLLAFLAPQWFDATTHYNHFTILGALIQVFYLNLALTFFNMIPLHPLDGGKMLFGILPPRLAIPFDQFASRYGSWILLLLFITGFYKYLIGYPITWMAHLLLG